MMLSGWTFPVLPRYFTVHWQMIIVPTACNMKFYAINLHFNWKLCTYFYCKQRHWSGLRAIKGDWSKLHANRATYYCPPPLAPPIEGKGWDDCSSAPDCKWLIKSCKHIIKISVHKEAKDVFIVLLVNNLETITLFCISMH